MMLKPLELRFSVSGLGQGLGREWGGGDMNPFDRPLRAHTVVPVANPPFHTQRVQVPK